MSVSNSQDLDQARCFVRPALSASCLKRLSADYTSKNSKQCDFLS